MGLLPRRDRKGLVGRHLAVHAGAIGGHDLDRRALVGVVRDAFADPFGVVRVCEGGRGRGREAESRQDEKRGQMSFQVRLLKLKAPGDPAGSLLIFPTDVQYVGEMKDHLRDKLLARVRQAFLDHGYEQLTMIGLAKACGLTRRALYHHFNGKEEAFREMLRWSQGVEIAAGFAAGDRALARGGDALVALVEIFEARYGDARSDLARSPHASEVNNEAFRRCSDIMAASSETFQERLATFVRLLAERGMLRLAVGYSYDAAAQLLADGARGVSQMLLMRAVEKPSDPYRRMCAAMLYGCAEHD